MHRLLLLRLGLLPRWRAPQPAVTAQRSRLGSMELLTAAAAGDVERVAQLIGPDVPWVFGQDIKKIAENQGIGPEARRPLIEAAANGQVAVVKLLLGRRRIMPSLADALGFTALHVAARSGHVEVVRTLARRPALLDVAASAGGLGATPLILAAERGHVAVTSLLLRSGASANCALFTGATALYKAAENGNCDVVMHLLACPGIQVNAALTADLRTPLHAASWHGNDEIVRLLLSRDDVHVGVAKAGATPLSLAAERGHVRVASLLLSRGADPNVLRADGTFPLFAAAQNGHVDLVRALLTHSELNVNATTTTESLSALYAAARVGHAEVVRALLAHSELEVNATFTPDGLSALHAAASNGHAEVVDALLTHPGLKANATTKDGSFALYAAARNGHEKVVRSLVNLPSIIIDARFPVDGTAALHMAARFGNATIARLLLSRSSWFPGDARATNGATPLILAAEHGHVDVARVLLEHLAGVNIATKSGETPLYMACSKGNLEFVQLLLAWPDVNPNTHGSAPSCALYVSCELGFSEIVRELLAHGADPNGHAGLARSPLLVACEKGHSACVAWLMTSQFLDVNHPDDDVNTTPLLAAAAGGHIECVRLLVAYEDLILERGGDEFCTPLKAANRSGHSGVVELLVAHAVHGQVRGVTRPLQSLYRSAKWWHCRDVLALAASFNLPAGAAAWFGSADEKSQALAFAIAVDEFDQAKDDLVRALDEHNDDGIEVLRADAEEGAAVDAALAAAKTLPEMRAADARERALMLRRNDWSLDLEPGVYGDFQVATLALAQADKLLAKIMLQERGRISPLGRSCLMEQVKRAVKVSLDAAI